MIDLLTKNVYRQTLSSIIASIHPEMSFSSLQKMVKSGVTIFRINFSWFEKAPKKVWVTKLRQIERIAIDEQLVLGIMLDTKGPEFRVRVVDANAIRLDGDPDGPIYEAHKKGFVYKPLRNIQLTLDPKKKTNNRYVFVESPLRTEFKELGERVVFGDGDYEANIVRRNDEKSMVICPDRSMCVWDLAKVNFPGTVLTTKALSEQDKEIIKFFLETGKDLDKRVGFLFAQSFIKAVDDVRRLSIFLQDTMGVNDPVIIAKLETYESSLRQNLRRIIRKASGVMIARGDLANQTSRGELPKLQREIIKVAKQFNKSILLATHVYGSMKDPRRFNCARPEAEDVRSALELGVDGFVLTEETTARPGDPEKVVQALAAQIQKDEEDLITEDKRTPLEGNHYERLREVERIAFHKRMRSKMRNPKLPIETQRTLGTTDFAIAAVFRANQYGAIGVFPFTVNGRTVKEMCRFYPETGIFPITHSPEVAHSLLLCRCTHPVLVKATSRDLKQFYIDNFKELVRKIVRELDLQNRKRNARYAICTMPHPPLRPGGTDTLLRIRIDS